MRNDPDFESQFEDRSFGGLLTPAEIRMCFWQQIVSVRCELRDESPEDCVNHADFLVKALEERFPKEAGQ